MRISAIESTRLGKIARLPLAIRDWLNERLQDGEPARALVKELNALPEVREMLEVFFEGRPINEQNLSAWKLGGFQEWQRFQRTRVTARDFLGEAAALEDEVDVSPEDDPRSFLDRVADRMALTLLQLFREAEDSDKSPERTRTLLAIADKLERMRQGDHRRQRTEILEQRLRDRRKAVEKAEWDKQKEKLDQDVAKVKSYARMLRVCYVEAIAQKRDLDAPWAENARTYFANNAEVLRQIGVPDLPPRPIDTDDEEATEPASEEQPEAVSAPENAEDTSVPVTGE
ncbi:MAG: hypothetical protein ABJF10_27305 [Chthoniobacter sp.]|uniref:hypothetical protein n=1 Tax=Chthoniobacter sp. TaxID=2510640 RepID=UPI0032A1F046